MTAAAQRFEIFAAGNVAPEALWAVVGDPRRLPEWTDAEEVERVDPEPLGVGTVITTRDDPRRGGPRRLDWEVVTLANRTLEAVTDTAHGRVGVGVRVVRETRGSRLVLAGAIRPAGSSLTARLLHAPALRRRFDRWSRRALDVARSA